MSDLLRVAFVGEGPTDKVVVECALASYAFKEHGSLGGGRFVSE